MPGKEGISFCGFDGYFLKDFDALFRIVINPNRETIS